MHACHTGCAVCCIEKSLRPEKMRLRLRGYAMAVIFTSGLLTSLASAQSHIVQPADIADMKRIEHPKISPDGRMVAYSVMTPVDAGKPRNEHIWIVNADQAGSSRLFVAGAGADTSPEWSPDGRHLAFLSNRPNPLATAGSPFHFSVAPGVYRADIPQSLIGKVQAAPGGQQQETKTTEQKDSQPLPPTAPGEDGEDSKTMQLWWISLDGGEAEPLTNLPGNIRSFKWSQDGRHIAFIRTDADTPAERERKKKKDDREIIDGEYHFDRLWVYDIGTHEAHLLTRQDANVDAIDWSPDGTSIVARVSPTPRLDDYWRVSVVEIFDTTTGAVRQVVEKNSGYQEPVYSEDGASIAYSRFTDRLITDMHLVRTLSTGKDVKLEDKLQGTIAEVKWLPENKLLVNAYVDAHTEAHVMDAATEAVTKLENMPPTALDLDSSKDGNTIAFLGETPAQPAEVSVWRSTGAAVLTSTNPQTKDWQLGEEREVHWTNPNDHRTIYGVLSLPPGYTPGKRYKTAIHIHGGPEEAFTAGFNANWYNYAVLLASQGYVVLQPNYRGSAGQDIAFTEADYRDWGGGDFEDVMAGVDWLTEQGIADPNQMVIAGWSYGGFMTSWAVTHTDRFKAAMAGAAVTDVYSMAITTDIAPSFLDSYMGPYAGSVNELDGHSAVRFAAACHTPVLVLHGQADVRVPLAQGQEFYHALRFLGREAEMVTYPREPHIFSEREHQIDSLTRELAWFAQHLSPSSAETR
jgi:dipeptidyl aminopeptidase/acylaminoacyl peptidase